MMRRLKSAFSLIELLIVILITATIGSVIMACFMGGMRAYQRVDEFSRNEADVYIAFEMFERDLKNLAVVPDIPFDGDSTIMQFPALSEIPGSDDGDSGISRVRYVYTRHSGVVRSVEKMGDESGVGADGDSITSADIEAVFSYGGAGDGGDAGWSDTWSGGSNFPDRVRIQFQVDGEDGDMLERIIVIPLNVNEKGEE
jgi:type II secretory pathway pseudopilin PulG